MLISNFHCQIIEFLAEHPFSIGPEIAKHLSEDEIHTELALRYLTDDLSLLYCTANHDGMEKCDLHDDVNVRMVKFGFNFQYSFQPTEAGFVAKEQYRFDEAQMEASKAAVKDCLFSRRISLISIILSIISIISSAAVTIYATYLQSVLK